jgi:hypothetical protein
MYTLRTLDDSKDGSVFNQALGQCYTEVNRFEHPERFRELFKQVFNKNHVADLDTTSDSDTQQTIGFIISADDNVIPINQGLNNYIMTDSGRTFERVNRAMTKQRIIK